MINMKKRNLKYKENLEIIVIIQEKFRGAAHLNYKILKEIPVKIHNG